MIRRMLSALDLIPTPALAAIAVLAFVVLALTPSR